MRRFEVGIRGVSTPPPILDKAKSIVHDIEQPLSLTELARLINVSQRTLQSAARDGRLAVTYDTRTSFGKVTRRATLQAGEEFKRTFYKNPTRWTVRPPKPQLPSVPENYDVKLVLVRFRLGLTQTQLATAISAGGKAVIYQWESRKRRPSPVFWERIERLIAWKLAEQ